MNPFIAVLENRGLVSEELVRKNVLAWKAQTVTEVRDELEEALRQTTYIPERTEDSVSAFNFLASAAMRGDYGCAAIDCHLEKVRVLARYAALYCDRVVFPVQLEPSLHKPTDTDVRIVLARGIASVLELRQLVEAGIVLLVKADLNYCPTCAPKVIPNHAEIERAARELTNLRRQEFSITFEPDGEGGYPITIAGPLAYLEHGSAFMRLRERPKWLPPDLRNRKGLPDVTLPKAVVRKANLGKMLIGDMAQDVALQQYYSVRYDTKYLTNMEGEAELLKAMNKSDGLTSRTAELCSRLAHAVPLLRDVPISTVVRIRKEDFAAFAQYRTAFGNIVRNHVAGKNVVSDADAKAIYFDELEPALTTLKREAALQRKASLRRSMTKATISSLLVGLGVYGGLLPTQIVQLCTAIGGFKLVADFAEAIAAIQRHPDEVKNHNLYFLLRLQEESSM